MARFRIRLGRDHGVRTAVAELLRVAGKDPELSADQRVLVCTRTHVLEAETVKKRWNKERLRDLLADITQFAGTAQATGDAVQAVRQSLSSVIGVRR